MTEETAIRIAEGVESIAHTVETIAVFGICFAIFVFVIWIFMQ